MSNDVCIENIPVVLTPSSAVSITGAADVPLCIDHNQEITVQKNEYSIVGDALYATVSVGEAPEWLTAIIDSVIDIQLSGSLSDLSDLRGSVIQALEDLEVARNQYEELINIEETIDRIITSRLTTLNASLDQANANIITLQLTTVTATQAAAIATTQIASSLNDGAISSAINNINTTISSLDETVANMYTSLVSNIEGIGSAISEVEVISNVLKDRLEASWSYNANLLLDDGRWYRSGFGLKTSAITGGDGSEGNPFSSEFWINAQKLRFTNDNETGSVTPFTIDATGATPEITFTGNVTIRNREDAVEGGIPVFLGSFASAPTAQVKGDTYKNTTDNTMYAWDGNSWISTAGKGISSTLTQYAISSSGSFVSDETWYPSVPTVPDNWYLWTRVTFYFTDGTSQYSYSVSRQGATGEDGLRGAGFFRIGTATGAWSNSTAVSALPDGIPVKDDTVTIYQNSSPNNATTRMWSGTAWVAPALSVHGNMVVDGTIVSQKVATGAIQGVHIQNGSGETGITAVKFNDWLISGTGNTPANAMLALNFRNGDAYMRNVYARGDIEASTIKANAANIVDTLHINGNAVTSMYYKESPDGLYTTSATWTNMLTSDPIPTKGGMTGFVVMAVVAYSAHRDYSVAEIDIVRNGTVVIGGHVGASIPNDDTVTLTAIGYDPNPGSNPTYTLRVRAGISGVEVEYRIPRMVITGGYR